MTHSHVVRFYMSGSNCYMLTKDKCQLYIYACMIEFRIFIMFVVVIFGLRLSNKKKAICVFKAYMIR